MIGKPVRILKGRGGNIKILEPRSVSVKDNFIFLRNGKCHRIV